MPRRAKSSSRVSAISRIAFGQLSLLLSVLLAAVALGLVPDSRAAQMQGRARICESIAISSSLLVQRHDFDSLQAILDAVVGRNGEILSAALRSDNDDVLIEVGNHAEHWGRDREEAAIDSHVYVPIWASDEHWGNVEVRFRPLVRGGLLGFIESPVTRLVAFVGSGSFLLSFFYLRRMLQHLDPSKAVPQRVRSALDTLAEGLLVLDDRGRIVLANTAFATTVGVAPERLQGVAASGFTWKLKHGDAELPWARSLESGATVNGCVVALVDADGLERTFMVNAAPVLADDGGLRGVLASFDDITLLEQKEIELRRAKEEADEANRAKSDFLARMSHEIRTPMNAILGFTDVMRRGLEESEAQRRDHLETVYTSGKHLLELINDILDLSKVESGQVDVEQIPAAPLEIIRDVLTVLGVRAREHGLTLAYESPTGIPATIITDPARLRQMLVNLVGNALKFTEKGGVTVVARLLHVGREPRLEIDVADTGIGMKPDALARIFDPFVQADSSITRRFGGTGLGLAISKQLAEALGGSLSVASEYGKGSTFTIALPTGPLDGVEITRATLGDLRARAAESGRETLEQSLAGARILLVEDGETSRKLMKLVLDRAGAHVACAENGREGVKACLAGEFDVVLMDMQMPVMDGYTAALTLREAGVTTPIIALTAHAMKGDDAKCRAAGCTRFLTKPIDFDVLVRTLGEELGEVDLSQRPAPEPRATKPAPAPRPVEPDAAPTEQIDAVVSSLPFDDVDFREIVEEFVERLHERLELLSEAVANGELSRVVELAHWLKGSGGTAGFHGFTDPARDLERAARRGDRDGVKRYLEDVTALASRVTVCETEWKRHGKGP